MRVAAVLLAVALAACSSEPDFSEDAVRGTWTLVSIDGQSPPVAAPVGQVDSASLMLGGCGNCSAFAVMLREPDKALLQRYALDVIWSVQPDGALVVYLDVPGADHPSPGIVTETDLTVAVTDIDRLPDGEYLFHRAP